MDEWMDGWMDEECLHFVKQGTYYKCVEKTWKDMPQILISCPCQEE